MRHDPWRREAASYPLTGELQPRFTDVDRWQHLNNTALITMHGEALQHALRSLFGPEAWRGGDPLLGLVSGSTDFLAEAYYPAPLTWGARVLGLDGEGLRIATALFQQGRCVGLHGATLAAWDAGRIVDLDAGRLAALRSAGVEGADVLPGPHAAHAAPERSAFPWRTSVKTRFGDRDAHRMASDAFLARCAEQMRVEFLDEIYASRREELGGMLVAHVALRWLHRGAPGPDWAVGCGVAHVGERSLAVRGAMFDGDRCVALCDSVMVAIDAASRRSAALPAGVRSALDPWRVRAS